MDIEDLLYSLHLAHGRKKKELIFLSIIIADSPESPRHLDLWGAQEYSLWSARSLQKRIPYSYVCVCVHMHVYIYVYI